jgi:hypothetical protein
VVPPVLLIPAVHLDLQKLREFSKKMETVLMGYSSLCHSLSPSNMHKFAIFT